MTWARFEDLLPLITLLLGYFGSLYTEARRDERARVRAGLEQVESVERAALIELQDVLVTLPQRWDRLRHSINEVLDNPSADGPDFSMTTDAAQARDRALALASRILDDKLREEVREAIFVACKDYTESEILELARTRTKVTYDVAAAWSSVHDAVDAVGERLRLPPA